MTGFFGAGFDCRRPLRVRPYPKQNAPDRFCTCFPIKCFLVPSLLCSSKYAAMLPTTNTGNPTAAAPAGLLERAIPAAHSPELRTVPRVKGCFFCWWYT